MSCSQSKLVDQLRDLWTQATLVADRMATLCNDLESPLESQSAIPNRLRSEMHRLTEIQAQFERTRVAWRESGVEKSDELQRLEDAWLRSVEKATRSVREAEARLQSCKSSLLNDMKLAHKTRQMRTAYGRS